MASLYFAMGLCFATWASRIPDVMEALGLSEAQLGSVLFALPAGQMVSMPLAGSVTHRYGLKAVITVSIVGYALSLLSLSFAVNGWWLAAGLFVFGAVGNFFNISVNAQGALVEKSYGRPIMASFHGAWSIAGFTGAMVGILFMAMRSPMGLHFGVVAGLTVVASLFACRHLLDADPETTGKVSFFVRPDPSLLKLGTVAFCSLACEGAMFDWSGVYFRQVVQAPEALVTLGYASFMFTMAGGRFMGDRLIARWGRDRLLKASGVLIFTGLMIAVWLPYLPSATLGFLIVGFGVSTVVPIVYTMAANSGTVAPGTALAMVSSIGFLGFLLGPPLIGYIAHGIGLQYAFALISVAGLGVTWLMRR